MQNIRKIASRRRLLTSTVAAFAAVGAAALTAVSIPADAAQINDYRVPTFISPAKVKSVFISTNGYAQWEVGSQTGAVGSLEEPVGIEICYTYPSENDGGAAPDKRVPYSNTYAFVTQAPGRPDPKRKTPDLAQQSDPRLLKGATMSVSTFTSEDCSAGLVKQFKGLTVPTSGPILFDLDLR